MIQFKTSEECDVELVAFTRGVNDDMDMDRFPARAARVSFANDKEDRSVDEDKKLIRYLASHQHLTPFEYQHAVLMIECPLFVRSQIHRHRQFSYNEISRRYTSDDLGFWVPDTFRGQSKHNRQASDGPLAGNIADALLDTYKIQCESALGSYYTLIEEGVAREQARAILPQSLLTRFYMGGNLRSWNHFLGLRQEPHAQPEIQVVARKINTILYNLWPTSLQGLSS